LSDRLGRRRPYLLGMMLALASTTGYLVSDGPWPLLVWRVVGGVAFSLVSVGGMVIILDLSRVHDHGRTVGNDQSLLQLGALVGLVRSGLLIDLLGYRGTLAIYAPLAALGLGIAWWTLPRVPSGDGPEGAAKPAEGAGPGTLVALRRLDPRLLVPAYVNFAILFANR
jgi:MFS family permease